jgi:DNA adenine methylase
MDHFQSIPPERRAEPFVKWAGGKKRMLSVYDSLFPSHFETYHEPFLGGGAVFLFLAHVERIGSALLSDSNAELIHLYRVVRDDVEHLIEELAEYPYENDFYYSLRATNPMDLEPVKRAARMLYLNRTCFNGLYRVNRKGQFNVPIGRYDRPVICNAANLRNVSALLEGIELQAWDFEAVLDVARPGDFVYLDPPYQPISAVQASGGRQESFSESQHGRLFEIFRVLDRRGCMVMLSTASTPLIRQLYARRYDVRSVQAPRQTTRRSGRRQSELVIRNY